MSVESSGSPHRSITYVVYKPHHDTAGRLSWHGVFISRKLAEAKKHGTSYHGLARIVKKETITVEFSQVVQWESFEATDVGR